jgi:hypothetical protein
MEDESNAELGENEGVDGFPTILVYKDGRKVGVYNGNRNEMDIWYYLDKCSRC